jgi:hypothetical protein
MGGKQQHANNGAPVAVPSAGDSKVSHITPDPGRTMDALWSRLGSREYSSLRKKGSLQVAHCLTKPPSVSCFWHGPWHPVVAQRRSSYNTRGQPNDLVVRSKTSPGKGQKSAGDTSNAGLRPAIHRDSRSTRGMRGIRVREVAIHFAPALRFHPNPGDPHHTTRSGEGRTSSRKGPME